MLLYMFAQRRNRLTTHFSERIPVVKRRKSVLCTNIHLALVYFPTSSLFSSTAFRFESWLPVAKIWDSCFFTRCRCQPHASSPNLKGKGTSFFVLHLGHKPVRHWWPHQNRHRHRLFLFYLLFIICAVQPPSGLVHKWSEIFMENVMNNSSTEIEGEIHRWKFNLK